MKTIYSKTKKTPLNVSNILWVLWCLCWIVELCFNLSQTYTQYVLTIYRCHTKCFGERLTNKAILELTWNFLQILSVTYKTFFYFIRLLISVFKIVKPPVNLESVFENLDNKKSYVKKLYLRVYCELDLLIFCFSSLSAML